MPVYDPQTLTAGHDGAMVRALEARGVSLTQFEEFAIVHGTYTRAGLLKWAGTNTQFVDHLVATIREIQDGIPGPCQFDVEVLRAAGLQLSKRELLAVAQGWGFSGEVLVEKGLRPHRVRLIPELLHAERKGAPWRAWYRHSVEVVLAVRHCAVRTR